MHLSKKEWGNSVWTFFHIIAFRIDENKYHIVKDDIINITKLICSNLPCPECSDHANNLLKNMNLEKILINKNSLIDFYFNFHNHINKKLKKPEFNKENLLHQYQDVNIQNVIQNINKIFLFKPNIPQMMNRNFQKKIVHKDIIKYINNIISNFKL